jgi:carbon-monoxide dehydrogenase medium subunit
MYPASFDYVAPTSLEEAIALLDRHGHDAKVVAGGQSLIPLMKFRFASPAVLVDINGIPGLDTIAEGEGGLRIGALVRHKDAERSDLLHGGRWGLLGATARLVADPLVRNRGTVCGSLAHADPQGDWASAMMAARGEVVANGPGGSRRIRVAELVTGPFETQLETNEIITEVVVPDPGAATGGTYLKLERKVGDYATAAVAAQVTMANGTIGSAGIALTGVGSRNIQATDAEGLLAGKEPSDELIKEAAKLAAAAADPTADNRGSVEYKRSVIRVFTERALNESIRQAKGGAL